MTSAITQPQSACGGLPLVGLLAAALLWPSTPAAGQQPDESGPLFSTQQLEPGPFVVPEPPGLPSIAPGRRELRAAPLPHSPGRGPAQQAGPGDPRTNSPLIADTIDRRPVFGQSAVSFGLLSRILEPGNRARQPLQFERYPQ